MLQLLIAPIDVLRGVALLDRNIPTWWQDRPEGGLKPINLQTLNVENGMDCVVGQLFAREPEKCLCKPTCTAIVVASGYGTGSRSLGLAPTLEEHSYYGFAGSDYPRLTQLWGGIIESRRKSTPWYKMSVFTFLANKPWKWAKPAPALVAQEA